ncbi:MAG: site-2 protease family protein [Candidatus Levybacteria bacterium]|nr:site-2 protease family protein [Candidatus Levybacteria bacterium]
METLIIAIVILVFSAILHEIAHGYVAQMLGDPTARLAGRLTLNPIPHLDPIMSIAVPILLIVSGSPLIFGAAKPVPVNPLMLREGRKDIALVALAGPLTNLALALIGALLLKLIGSTSPTITEVLFLVIRFNLALGFLNLIPVPPLDGSKFFSIVMPERVAQQYFALAPFGIFILFLLLLATPMGDLLNILILNSMQILGI